MYCHLIATTEGQVIKFRILIYVWSVCFMNLETSTDIETTVIYVSDIDLTEQTLYITGIYIYMA